MAHTVVNKTKLVGRVRRIAGQLAAIERAIEADTGCSQILQQVAAARGAMNGLLDELVEDHLRHHVADPDLNAEERQSGADELIAIIRRYSK
ncbi:MAG: metal/formaldehyde-sensitive transcriptional repressor [Proteobacteria bacterium]|nr:metal/formaldehyde-sensitive transcriptional repressor [Pseudomonadota bacterium]